MCIHAVYEYIWWTREEFVSDEHVSADSVTSKCLGSRNEMDFR